MDDVQVEIDTMKKELKWILREQVPREFLDILGSIHDCCRRLPIAYSVLNPDHVLVEKGVKTDEAKALKPTLKEAGSWEVISDDSEDDDSLIQTQRILLTCPSGESPVKCVATLLGDCLTEVDVTFKHKHARDGTFKSSIGAKKYLFLTQIQDSSNYLLKARDILEEKESDKKVFSSSIQVIKILDEVIANLSQGRTCLAVPKRKSIDDLVHNQNMQLFVPSVPNDIAMSFYIHTSKLVLALYHLHYGNNHKIDIVARNQVECNVQWLNEAVMLFSLALQQCQHLKDKILLLQRYEDN